MTTGNSPLERFADGSLAILQDPNAPEELQLPGGIFGNIDFKGIIMAAIQSLLANCNRPPAAQSIRSPGPLHRLVLRRHVSNAFAESGVQRFRGDVGRITQAMIAHAATMQDADIEELLVQVADPNLGMTF